jgi:gliding motility-associated-like protein
MRFGFLLFFSFILVSSSAQLRLIINEVSQGPSGNKEYVEFLVAGAPGCISPIPCLDLRGMVLDDNNGYFAPGAGSGIAGGAVRFSNVSELACVPQGTLIVIYNPDDIHPLIPPVDGSVSDGNCLLCIPVSSPLLEVNTTGPVSSDPSYPTSGWSAGAATWSVLGMANGGDSFQVRQSITDPTPNHGVSWGNNSSNTIIYFAGSAVASNFSMVNSISDNEVDQANWVTISSGTPGETPGEPNNAENDNWISNMNPSCGSTPLTVNVFESIESCTGFCDGTIGSLANGGTGPYTYNWSTGQSGETLTDLCSGNYTVQVTDANGCQITQTGTINLGALLPTIVITGPSTSNTFDIPISFSATPPGGNWSSNCGTCINAAGVFDPQLAGIGAYQICYAKLNSLSCGDTVCQTMVVSSCSVPAQTSNYKACEGEIIAFGNQLITETGIYEQTFLTSSNCDSTHTLTVNYTACDTVPFSIFVPNVFSPNNDQINDLWEIKISGASVWKVTILNRWGNKVSELIAPQTSWDGSSSISHKITEGVYTYLIELEKNNGQQENLHGFVTIFE